MGSVFSVLHMFFHGCDSALVTVYYERLNEFVPV